MIQVAAQMYSIRDYSQKNGYGASLKELARIGFKSVEHACSFQEFEGKPAELRKFMADLGLTMMGTHLGSDALFDPEKRKKTIDLYAALGAKYLICPYSGLFFDCDSQTKFIDDMNEAAEALKPYGMVTGYHCHMNEFLINPKSGKTYWDTFAEATGKDVVLEQDCGWSTMASQDAAALICKYPNRSGALHFKPAVRASQSGKIAIIGEDSVPWKKIIAAAKECGGTEYFVIEQEWYLPGKTDMESLERSYNGLAKLL